MPFDPNNPDAPSTGHPPETSAAQTTEGGTLRQDAPPSWAMSGDAPSASASASSDARSGREISALDREIASNQAAGIDIAEGYSLIRKLGTGAFGTVWEAENRLTRERVAIKFFTASDANWASLLGEVGLLQSVEGCRGIVLVKEVRQGSASCRPHYVMQLANQGSLADWLKKANELPSSERLKLTVSFFTRVARAMAAVHRRGIHHCDLKPQNILLHAPESGTPPEPLVADFGQAHFATDDTPALGTFFYMPPDQIDAAQAGTPSDTRWDVYALGAIVYEMLTGEAPRRSPELVERIKKAPKSLTAKMAIYREGILAAPSPEAHKKIADPMLAKIIDRCLNLRPDKRPADAGALVAHLDSRARWRRTRPVLALAAVATLLLVAIVTGLGLLTADKVTEQTKARVSTEVMGSLARTAGYGTRAIEDRLQRHVVGIEQWSLNAHETDLDAINALKNASSIPRGPKLADGSSLQPSEHEAIRNWLKRIQKSRKDRLKHDEHMPSLGVMVVADDELTKTPQSRGFYVARIHSDDSVEETAGAENDSDRGIFINDMSYRDYFHVGPGEDTREAGRPHAVVRATQISHPFRSRGVDRSERVGPERHRWKLNIATPIWDDPKRPTRVVGLLVLGLDVEYDVYPLLYPMQFQRPADSGTGYGIDQHVKVVVADHRGRWIWHPDCRDAVDSDQPSYQNPHSYPQLVRKHNLTEDQAGPWLTLDAPGSTNDRHGYTESEKYVDPLETELHGEQGAEIACFTRFDPYARSRYGAVDATGKPAPPRRWVFVAQVDRKKALHPLDEMKNEIVHGGVMVVATLSLIAAGLWIGLVRVLRRLEFASHG